jgi:anti-anti-sigma factor
MTQGSEQHGSPHPTPREPEAPFGLLQVAVSEPRPAVLVVAPVGEVDVATSGILRDAALDALRAGPRHLVIDLGGLTFCGSTGLVVLLETRHAAEEAGVRFGTLGGRPIVRRVLEITGLGPILGHRETLDEMLAPQNGW